MDASVDGAARMRTPSPVTVMSDPAGSSPSGSAIPGLDVASGVATTVGDGDVDGGVSLGSAVAAFVGDEAGSPDGDSAAVGWSPPMRKAVAIAAAMIASTPTPITIGRVAVRAGGPGCSGISGCVTHSPHAGDR